MLCRLAQQVRSQPRLVAVHGLCERYTHLSETLVSSPFWCQLAHAQAGRKHLLSCLVLNARADGFG